MTTINKRTKPREVVRLATLERRNGAEQIRWSWDEFTDLDGELSTYVNARKWYLGRDGQWRPTRFGVTIRATEIDEVVTALQRVQHVAHADGASDDD